MNWSIEAIKYKRQTYDRGVNLSAMGKGYRSVKAENNVKLSQKTPHKDYRRQISYLPIAAIEEGETVIFRQPLDRNSVLVQHIQIQKILQGHIEIQIISEEKKAKQKRKVKETPREDWLTEGNIFTENYEDTEFQIESFDDVMDFFSNPNSYTETIDGSFRDFRLFAHDIVQKEGE